MSIKAMNWAWGKKGLKPAQKLVLMKLADHANDDGVCWPGKGSISEDCGVSKRTLDSIIQCLVAGGLITLERRRRLDNPSHNHTNVYYLQIEQQELIPGAETALGGSAETALGGSAETALGVVQKLHQVVQPPALGVVQGAAPEPSYNHQEPRAARARATAAFDYSNWQPDDTILARIRMDSPGITDHFLETELREFITYAEDQGLRANLLRARFVRQVRRNWRQALQREGNRGPLRQTTSDIRDVPVGDLESWSRARDGPLPAPGESADNYRQRVIATISNRGSSEHRNPAIDRLAAAISV